LKDHLHVPSFLKISAMDDKECTGCNEYQRPITYLLL